MVSYIWLEVATGRHGWVGGGGGCVLVYGVRGGGWSSHILGCLRNPALYLFIASLAETFM